MAFRIKSQTLRGGQKGSFIFPESAGPVRQYVVGLSGWNLVPRADRGPGEHVALSIKSQRDAEQPQQIHCEIEASIDGEPCSTVACEVSCIADVGAFPGDSTPDSCALFVAEGGEQGADLPDPQRFREPVMIGLAGSQVAHGLLAMGAAEGRTFCKVVVDEVPGPPMLPAIIDFADVIGTGVKIQAAALFLQETTTEYRRGWVGGGASVSVMGSPRESCVLFTPGLRGKTLIVVRTASVILNRESVELRLSEGLTKAGDVEYFWEWKVSEHHWHRTARVSDDLDWFEGASGGIDLRVGNNTSRGIDLTLDGNPWVSVEPRGATEPGVHWSPVIRFEGGQVRTVWGTFADGEKEDLPDPTFTPIKQGGG